MLAKFPAMLLSAFGDPSQLIDRRFREPRQQGWIMSQRKRGAIQSSAVRMDRPVQHAVRRHFADGSIILLEGDAARTVYFVGRGAVRVFRTAPTGRETTTAVLGPDQLFGIAPIFGQSAYHASAQALGETEVWAWTTHQLWAVFDEDPDVVELVAEALSRRLAFSTALLRDVALLPVRGRVANTVAHFGAFFGRPCPSLTREQMAGLIGARRETVSRAAADELSGVPDVA
jgi:CRP/FNR family transcriptional regulator